MAQGDDFFLNLIELNSVLTFQEMTKKNFSFMCLELPTKFLKKKKTCGSLNPALRIVFIMSDMKECPKAWRYLGQIKKWGGVKILEREYEKQKRMRGEKKTLFQKKLGITLLEEGWGNGRKMKEGGKGK